MHGQWDGCWSKTHQGSRWKCTAAVVPVGTYPTVHRGCGARPRSHFPLNCFLQSRCYYGYPAQSSPRPFTFLAPRLSEEEHLIARLNSLLVACAALAIFGAYVPVRAADKKPNILVIWGDDIGQFNVSAYNRRMMGYKTPNIDRLAAQGADFTDSQTR